MLLVTNGDSAAERIERPSLTGEVLPWRDVLHEGQAPARLSNEELQEVRARFLADRGWARLEDALEVFAERDATLEGFGGHEELVRRFPPRARGARILGRHCLRLLPGGPQLRRGAARRVRGRRYDPGPTHR